MGHTSCHPPLYKALHSHCLFHVNQKAKALGKKKYHFSKSKNDLILHLVIGAVKIQPLALSDLCWSRAEFFQFHSISGSRPNLANNQTPRKRHRRGTCEAGLCIGHCKDKPKVLEKVNSGDSDKEVEKLWI